MYAIRSYYAYFARSTISARRQRLSRESGRVSTTLTVSPTLASVITSYSIHYTKLYDLRAAEAEATGGAPRYSVTVQVGDGDDGIVEGRLDIDVALVYALLLFSFLCLSHA